MKKILLFFIASTLALAGSTLGHIKSEETKKIKKELEDLEIEINYTENLKYDGLDDNAKKEIEEYTINMSQKIDILKDKIKTRYKLGNFTTAGESFLESLEDNEEKFSFGIINKSILNKNLHKNNTDVFFIKKINNDGNIFGVGLYGGYSNSKYKKYTDKSLHGLDIGIVLEGELPEYGVKIVSMNEFNKDFKINNENYLSNSIIGGLAIIYKKKFGSLFYVEPNLFMLYGSNINTNLKFSDTNVYIKNNFMYNVGTNLKLGLENEIERNIYNFYVETSFDKKISKNNDLIFGFKDKERNSIAPLENDINIDLGLGFDILLNKEHRFHIEGGIGLIPDEKVYKIGVSYELLK
ncbi:DUF481 domain-containing protein [Streptobacillus notomytis]|uniref:DUF481 domain-containing protein n=1 Tax=Streptobacillus notomytis TaxID=1712031 RepID=UPI00082D75FF|nr:DUF481 domain-containing protein [Streptobacillus notomytis]